MSYIYWYQIKTYEGNVKKRSLEEAFNAVFHGKQSFTEFCSTNNTSEVIDLKLNNRSLTKPTDKLKIYLRFIDKVLLRYLAKDIDVVHSYVKGRSPLTAVQKHAINTHFFTTDISAFFSSITKSDIINILKRDKALLPISDIDNYIQHLAEIMTIDNTLPAGFPTSPQLSNAFLFNFDLHLKAICLEKEFSYTRYSDDIIISSTSFNGFENLTKIVQEALQETTTPQLALNENKTRFRHVGNKVKILGLVITPNGRVTLDSKYKKQLEVLLHFYTSDKEKFNKIVNETLSGKEHSLFGLLHYAQSVDPEYIEKLQRKYGVLALRSLMRDKWND